MSELIQVKKQLTFEELCPEWSNMLSTGVKTKNAIVDPERCIVGEAHGFTGVSYWSFGTDKFCATCDDFSIDFCNYISYEKVRGGYKNSIWEDMEQDFELLKAEFVQHFNECHISSIPH